MDVHSSQRDMRLWPGLCWPGAQLQHRLCDAYVQLGLVKRGHAKFSDHHSTAAARELIDPGRYSNDHDC